MELKTTVWDIGRMRWEVCDDEINDGTYYRKRLYVDDETGMVIDYIYYPEGFMNKAHRHKTAHGIYVLDGQLETDEELYGAGTFIWYPEGVVSNHGAYGHDGVKFFLISTGRLTTEYLNEGEKYENTQKKKVIDVNCMPWFYRTTSTDGKFFGKKAILTEEEAGIQINYMNYPAGFTTYNHRHTAGHCFFVFSGQLQSGDNLYGPGTFIWYPEGYVTGHGATAYEDLICLQVSNKPFAIEYVK